MIRNGGVDGGQTEVEWVGGKERGFEGGEEDEDGNASKKVRQDISVRFESYGPAVGGAQHPRRD